MMQFVSCLLRLRQPAKMEYYFQQLKITCQVDVVLLTEAQIAPYPAGIGLGCIPTNRRSAYGEFIPNTIEGCASTQPVTAEIGILSYLTVFAGVLTTTL